MKDALRCLGWVLALGFILGVSSLESRAAETLKSFVLRIEFCSNFYRVIERSHSEVVSESGGIFFTENQYAVRNSTNVTKENGSILTTLLLEGTSELAQASFKFVKPEFL